MEAFGNELGAPALPSNLKPLIALSRDLRWAWRPSIRALFSSLDPGLWSEVRGNPAAFLRQLPERRLAAASDDPAFLATLHAVASDLALEDMAQSPHPSVRGLWRRGERIAYFCAEFGLTETLPIYSGGLGVLAGDLLKSANNLRLPLVGVGLFYREGYFHQTIDREGWQHETNVALDPRDLPISIARTPDGGPPTVLIELGDRPLQLLIRVAQVGQVPLFLLDANLPENHPDDRDVTARLYAGDQEMRIRQEVALGIGGIRALKRLGISTSIRHINEGHSAFAVLEKIRHLVAEKGFTLAEARELTSAGNVFTTHTPVPAGIDRFPAPLIEKYLSGVARDCGITIEELMRMGREVPEREGEPFSMAVLALRHSSHTNAVSQLHARVSRRLWLELLPELADVDVRIQAITNGVHRETWTDPEIAMLRLPDDPSREARVELWRTHESLRARLVEFSRQRQTAWKRAVGAPEGEIEAAGRVLDPEAMTIGFARRFATYKQATLVFSDPERLKRLLDSRPIQIVFAGKAHPLDDPAKELLRDVVRWAESPEFRGRVVFLPEYDMGVARALVAGCDVWLNNPIRPHEASGTSGMKAAMNGGLNFSVLDGWWDEAPHDEAGFAIGEATDESVGEPAANALYDALEQQVVPLFFERDENGIPWGWIEKMVFAATRIARRFSSDRMVTEYLELCYLPAAERRLAAINGRLKQFASEGV
ncbi:MAG TPA: alpha-glucan family phosphorylase [Thermoanaerobaculia bacterium]|nr:alpha-glucan family phosphorylase [Thermoanaerobaculia bacterium]